MTKYDDFTIPLEPGTTVTIPEDAVRVSPSWNDGVWGIFYRVPRPEPVIGEVVLYGYVSGGIPIPVSIKLREVLDTHRFRYRTVDGVSDGTFTMEEL